MSSPYPYEAPVSAELFARSGQVTPGGVNSLVRAFRAVGGTPRFMASGSGPWLTDVDGRRYVDLVSSWGPMILGHAHPAVVERGLRHVVDDAAGEHGRGVGAEATVVEAGRHLDPHGAALQHLAAQLGGGLAEGSAVGDHDETDGCHRGQPGAPSTVAAASTSRTLDVAPGSR